MGSILKTASVALVSLCAGLMSVSAATINYNDFSNPSGLTLNGDTYISGSNTLVLTDGIGESGSAFSTSAINLANQASFSTFFSFNISDNEGVGDGDGIGADGIVFAVQTVSNTAGGAGGGIGYQGINNSVGIEFDTFGNGHDPDGNHIGINLNGNVTSVATTSIPTLFNNSSTQFAWIDYDGTSDELEVRWNNVNLRPVTADLSYTVDLTTVLGQPNAFVGFTSGTGLAASDHEILSWQFEDDFAPLSGAAVPEPSTYAMLALGLLGLGVYTRRRKK